jgi:hypothetical protein
MTLLRLLIGFAVTVTTGFAAGILFVGACAASAGAPTSPQWMKTLGVLWWLPPLLGLIIGTAVAIMQWRRKRRRRRD